MCCHVNPSLATSMATTSHHHNKLDISHNDQISSSSNHHGVTDNDNHSIRDDGRGLKMQKDVFQTRLWCMHCFWWAECLIIFDEVWNTGNMLGDWERSRVTVECFSLTLGTLYRPSNLGINLTTLFSSLDLYSQRQCRVLNWTHLEKGTPLASFYLPAEPVKPSL